MNGAAQAAIQEAARLRARGQKREAAELLIARGAALSREQRYEEALAVYRAAAVDPGIRYDALALMGTACAQLGRHEEAIALIDQAVALRPALARAPYQRAFSRLALCDFAGGWEDYERRLEIQEFLAGAGVLTPGIAARLTPRPTREAVRGRRVLLVGEQGVGDVVMFASCLPDLLAEAAAVTLVCEHKLVALLAGSFPGLTVMGSPGAQVSGSAYDVILAMGSLGRLYRNAPADFPGGAYLCAAPEATARWAGRLGPRTGALRVGLSWRGGTAKTNALGRSLDLAQLAPVLATPGCEFVSLQYGQVAPELAAAAGALPAPIRAFAPAEIDDFAELAGLVANLDVVVSVQTAIVHLTGALGRTGFILAPHVTEWRYTARQETIPWYPSIRLFRQPEPGDWGTVIDRAAEALRRAAPVGA
ncbi:hypothetical protein [Phenylobacterium sp.]|uniref:tetratricopeptide repeat-containing glycosyltransferase family protein n=1 Tax=Phenylobacterium sp. TaxID=1871053 RepID=UPI0035AD967F